MKLRFPKPTNDFRPEGAGWIVQLMRLSIIVIALAATFRNLNAQSPFDGHNLGTLDPLNLVVVHDDPIELAALDVLSFKLPLDLSGENPVAILLIDPDGNQATDNSFVLPIQLDDQLVADPQSLLAEIGIDDDLLSNADLGLIPGLASEINTLTSGLLSLVFGLGNELSIDDVTSDLNGAVIEAVAIDIGGLLGYTLGSTLTVVGFDNWMISEVEAATVQPDITIGQSPNRGPHVGEDQYSGGAGQTLWRNKSRKGPIIAYFTFQNDGNATDTFEARSRSIGARHLTSRVLYRGNNVTAGFQSGSFQIEQAPGEIESFSLLSSESRNTKKRKKPVRKAQAFSINLRSTSDPSKFDEAEIWTSLKTSKRKRR